MRAILTYHSLDASGSVISVAPEVFRAQMAWLAASSVRVASLQDLVLGEGLPPDAVALTFDDGYRNVADTAAPLLAEHGFPATVFAVTGHAGRTNAWDGQDAPGIPTLPLMDWDALGRLQETGWEIGAHTRHHPDLTRCDDARLQDELEGAAEEFSRRLGRRPDALAYPFGAVDDRVVRAATGVYGLAVTTIHAELAPGAPRLRLPRLDMYYYRRPGALTGWGGPGFRSGVVVRGALRKLGRLVRSG